MVAVVGRGGVALLPTETVYGLVTLPAHVARIFEIKDRPSDKNVQLLAPGVSWLERVGRPSPAARRLAEVFWPGPLTLVVAAGDEAPSDLASDGTIGVRVPGHELALRVLRRTGPLAASSANRSGQPTPSTAAEIEALFGTAVDAYLDGGRIDGSGSTVVDVTPPQPVVLREGPIARAEVERVCAGPI